jgi:hypothetical protein
MKIKITIKNRWTGSIIFDYEKENNTVKETVKELVRLAIEKGECVDLQGVDLRGADLQGADLQGADLKCADLRRADLRGADLQRADLRRAYLQGVDLQGVDLRGADLQGAYLQGVDLQGVDLRGAYLQRVKIKTAVVFTGLYQYIVIPYITKTNEKRIKMGCYDRLLSEWESDFWNNNNEFPNDNSFKSNSRLMAFETAKKWFEIIEKSKYLNRNRF